MISWQGEAFLSNKNKTAHCGTFCIRLRGAQGVEFPALILMLSTGIALWPLGRNSTTQLSFLLNSSAGCRSQLQGFTWCRNLWRFSPEQHLSNSETSAIATIQGDGGSGEEILQLLCLCWIFLYSHLLPSWWFWRTPNGFHYLEWNNICSTNIVPPWEAPRSSSSSLYNITTHFGLYCI